MSQHPYIHAADFEASPKLRRYVCLPTKLSIRSVSSRDMWTHFKFNWLRSSSSIKTWVGDVTIKVDWDIYDFGHSKEQVFCFHKSLYEFIQTMGAGLPCKATVASHTVTIKTRLGKQLHCRKGHLFINVFGAYGFDGWVVSPEVFASHYQVVEQK